MHHELLVIECIAWQPSWQFPPADRVGDQGEDHGRAFKSGQSMSKRDDDTAIAHFLYTWLMFWSKPEKGS